MDVIKNPITPEELYNNLEFKAVKRIVMQEYPFIKDMILKDPNDINKYNIIFLDAIVDTNKLSEYYQKELSSYAITPGLWFNTFSSPYLSTFFKDRNKDATEDQEKMDQLLKSVKKSRALPETLKLPPNRSLMMGSFLSDIENP